MLTGRGYRLCGFENVLGLALEPTTVESLARESTRTIAKGWMQVRRWPTHRSVPPPQADGSYSYALKYPLPDGSGHLRLSGQQMIGRIALLIPRPKLHLIRYAGVFAGHSSWRPLIEPP
ncbi:MAG: transposase [Deltaproteobacteria bacterium]|nr:transposase [Deltaproteobacteria bacterium]